MQANFEQIIQRILDMGDKNINSTFFSHCAVEFGTNIFSAVKIVWLIINIFPLPPFKIMCQRLSIQTKNISFYRIGTRKYEVNEQVCRRRCNFKR